MRYISLPYFVAKAFAAFISSSLNDFIASLEKNASNKQKKLNSVEPVTIKNGTSLHAAFSKPPAGITTPSSYKCGNTLIRIPALPIKAARRRASMLKRYSFTSVFSKKNKQRSQNSLSALLPKSKKAFFGLCILCRIEKNAFLTIRQFRRSRNNPSLTFGTFAEVGKVQNSPFGTFAESKKCQNLKTAFLPMNSFFLRLCSSRLPKQEKCTAGDSASQNLLQEGKNERQGKKKRTDTEKMRTRRFLPLLPSLNVIVIRLGFRALLNFWVPNALAKPPQRISERV